MHSSGYLDLGNERDVADFLLRRRGEPGPAGSDGYESAASSASSVAGDDADADAVSLADDYVGRNNRKGQRRAIRLDEIGPRMELRLIKIAEGMPGKEGGVIYHEFGAFQYFLKIFVYFIVSTIFDTLVFCYSQKIQSCRKDLHMEGARIGNSEGVTNNAQKVKSWPSHSRWNRLLRSRAGR